MIKMNCYDLRIITSISITYWKCDGGAEIEEYHSEAGVAVFAWKQKGNEELGLLIELSKMEA